MATHVLRLDNCKSYATETNLHLALSRLGLAKYGYEGEIPCRYIVANTPDGRWTAVFLVSEYLRANNTGGYVGFASQHGFLST